MSKSRFDTAFAAAPMPNIPIPMTHRVILSLALTPISQKAFEDLANQGYDTSRFVKVPQSSAPAGH
jgi:hypothetical protein